MIKNSLLILKDDATLKEFKERAFEVASEFDITNILPLYEAVYEKAYRSSYNNTY
jgi:hypothetical protein